MAEDRGYAYGRNEWIWWIIIILIIICLLNPGFFGGFGCGYK